MKNTNSNGAEGKARKHDRAIMAVLELLAERFPKCFVIYEHRRKPLKVGIHHDIMAALDGVVTPEQLSKALRTYVCNKVYRKRLVAGATRVDLDGAGAGVVTPEQATVSTKSNRKAAPKIVPAQTPKRLSLADLRAAAKRRKLVECNEMS